MRKPSSHSSYPLSHLLALLPGWFCGAKPVVRKAKLSILPPGSNTWTEVKLKDDVRAIVLLNLQVRAFGNGVRLGLFLNNSTRSAAS